MLLGEVARVLNAHEVPRRGDQVVVVACSGGLDSVVLADVCVEVLGARRVILGHVDHGVRPDSALDTRLVEDLGQRLGVQVESARLGPGPDDEARLRDERYRALESLRAEAGAELILTAHTREDQAETVLMTLLRSTVSGEPRGIPVRRGRILRPMLRVPRDQVRRHAERRGLFWTEDPSNREPRYLRNRIRKELLPLLECRYRPGIRRRLAGMAEGSENGVGRRGVQRNVMAQPPQKSPLPGAEAPARPEPWIAMRRLRWAGGPVPDGRDAAVFDAEAIQNPSVRPVRPGERVQPYGMLGRRKVNHVLREAGVPPEDRSGRPVVVDGQDRVIWVPGALRAAVGGVD